MGHDSNELIEITDGKDAETLCMPCLDAFAENHVNGLFKVEQSPEAQIDQWRVEAREYMKDSIGSMAKAGDLSVIRVNGEVAGIAGHKLAGQMPDGRNAYEIMRVSVLRKFRKKNLHIDLMNHVFRQLQATYAKSPLLIHSQTPSIKEWAEQGKFTKLPLRTYAKIKGFTMTPENLEEWIRDQEEKLWCAYVFEPDTNTG